MGEPNGTVSAHSIRHQTTIDHYCTAGQTTGPTGQGVAVMQPIERLQYDKYNRNSDTMNANTNSSGITECKATTRTTVSTAPRDRDRESLFGSESTSANNCGDTGIDTFIGRGRGNRSRSTSVSTGIFSNASGNVCYVGRGRHRLKQKRIATRADRYSIQCLAVAAPVVPVSKSRSENCNSAFDNKAFSSDGDSVDSVDTREPQTQCLPTNALSLSRNQAVVDVISERSTNTSNTCISDRLFNNENNSNVCIDSCNKAINRFMKTQNESESALKGQQYCSSADNCHAIRARSSRSTRSSVVKHIGVFYSDLCDVIKAMRSGTNTNTSTNNHNISNANNNNSDNHTTPPPPQHQQTCVSNANTHRNNITTSVLLHNEHITASVPVPQQQQQSSTPIPYPLQPQAITCLQSSQTQTPLTSGNGSLRSASQTQIRLNETQMGSDLPDILNSHLPPPPYSTLPPPGIHLPPLSSLPALAPIRVPPPPPPPPPLPAGRPPLPSRRILHAPTGPLAHCSRPNYLRPNCAVSETETSASKTCLSCNGVSIRWFILLIAFIGLLCAIIGTILGALRTTGREHLTLALLMIGVGIILITVSGIAWRLTSSGPTWRSILGLHELHQQQSLCNGSSINEVSRRFVPRVPAPYGRTGTHHHPYGAMFYPEFQYRPPPPSYQASMQEYRLRLLLLDRTSSHPQSTSLSPVSPPPTYRSSAASSLTGTLTRRSQCNTIQRAPSYRTMASGDGQPMVSTTPSYQSSTTQTVVQPQALAPMAVSTNTTATSTAVSPTLTTSQTITQTQHSNTLKPLTHKSSHHSSHHDINRVTILQTTNTSQVCTPNGVNIVAISPTTIMAANPSTVPNLSAPIMSSNEVQILAHV